MAHVELAERILVQVAYARADMQTIIELELEAGATVGQAIAASGLDARYPEIDIGVNVIGVFGRPVTPDRLLRNRDRVEIYRPLLADPKERRRRRATRSKGPR